MNLKFKKPKIKITIIAMVVIASFLFTPQLAKANIFVDLFLKGVASLSPASIARAILAFTIDFVFNLLNLLVRAAASFFNGMLNMGFQSHLSIVRAGWQVTRDFSNMFFILFMIIIAFATILRIERYGIKELLPKVIIIALLINFSLVICSVIIDFSNIAANFFINDIKRYAGGDAAGRFTTSLRLIEAYTPLNCYELSDQIPDYPPEYTGPRQSPRDKCLQRQTAAQQAAQIGTDFLTFVISMTMGSLVFLIAAFVLFAGGILLLIRIVFIWFLVMLVPLVFLCYLMPALRKQWQKWWNSFLSWCFFAPAYAFFIWLAMKVSIEGRTQELARLNSPDFTDMGALANIFTSAPATALIHYFFIIALLVGGLIAAKQFGIYGASTAMAIGQKWGRAAASRVTRYPREVGTLVSGAVAREMGKGLQKIPGFRGFGRGLEQRGVLLQRRALESKQMKDFEKLVDLMSSKQKEAEIRGGISPARSTKAALSAMRAGELEKMSTETQRIAERMFRAYGFRKESEDLIAKNPAIIENKGDREEAVKEDTEKGNHKNYREKAFEGTEGQEIADYMIQSQVTAGDAAKTLKEMRKDTQAMALKANRASFNNNFTDANEIRRRSVEAIMTGKIDVAFTDTRTGMVNEPALKAFVKKIQPEHFRDIDPASIPAIAKYVDTSAAVEMGRYISGEKKKKFADEFNTRTQDQKDILKKAPGWASYIT